MRFGLVVFIIFVLQGCTSKYEPVNFFSDIEGQQKVVNQLIPYVLPKPEMLSFENRFSDSSLLVYKDHALADSLYLHSYFINAKDSLHYFMFIRRDRKSLYQDYRAVAGTCTFKDNKVNNLELKFLTPMFRKDTVELKAPLLFKELVEQGALEKYIGDRNYVDWPSNDVYYNKVEKKWSLKANSEWATIMNEASK